MILDFYLNPLVVNVGSVIGYRENITDFPHDIYSFLLSSIREQDQNNVGLIYRFTRAIQDYWEAQNYTINSLLSLLSPDDCPEEYLIWLRSKVGITDDLNYIWGRMTENEQRKFIKYFIRFLQFRASNLGIIEVFESITGHPVLEHGYFYYRWVLSGDSEYEMETALGREDLGYDPWLLSEDSNIISMTPSKVVIEVNPITGKSRYLFTVTELINTVVDPPIPELIVLRCKLTTEVIFGRWYESGGVYYVVLGDDYFFGQELVSATEVEENFTIGFELDQYVYDICVVDDGVISHDLLVSLAQWTRPMSERVYLRYYNLIEDFKKPSRWDITGFASYHSASEEVMYLIGFNGDEDILLNYLNSANWSDYTVEVKFQFVKYNPVPVGRYTEIRFMRQDADNYYYVRLTPSVPPAWPAGTWALGAVIATVDTPLANGTTEWMDYEVNYIWRIDCRTSERPGGDVQIISVYQDENLLVTYVDDPVSWATAYGTIQIVCEDRGEAIIDLVNCHPLPMESDYIGPGTV